jgi:hypothetical protein
MDCDFKVKENRFRRTLKRRGYELIKNRRRDQKALNYGLYQIKNLQTNEFITDWITFNEVEIFINK